MPVTLEQQIACVKREIAMRERVYPSFVARGKMKPHEAEYQIDAMKAALATLQGMQWNQQEKAAPKPA